MSALPPKYMSIGDFCRYSGFSRYQFMRMADKANLKIKALGQFRMVNVQDALAAIEALPDADREEPAHLQEALSKAGEILNTATEATETETAA